jgi:hypothetical protein
MWLRKVQSGPCQSGKLLRVRPVFQWAAFEMRFGFFGTCHLALAAFVPAQPLLVGHQVENQIHSERIGNAF